MRDLFEKLHPWKPATCAAKKMWSSPSANLSPSPLPGPVPSIMPLIEPILLNPASTTSSHTQIQWAI